MSPYFKLTSQESCLATKLKKNVLFNKFGRAWHDIRRKINKLKKKSKEGNAVHLVQPLGHNLNYLVYDII